MDVEDMDMRGGRDGVDGEIDGGRDTRIGRDGGDGWMVET